MKVDQSKNSPVQNSETSGAKHSGRAAAAQDAKKVEKGSASEPEKASHHGARTEISSKGKEFASAKAAASEAPDVREDKVADLKRRIAEGSYKVNTEAVADRMIDDHLKMSGIGGS
jgi:negative regulator of flagellin synthesis FlgM